MAADKKDDKPPERIIFNSDLYFGMTFYLTADPKQEEYQLIGVRLLPGVTDKKGNHIPAVKFHLESASRKIWAYDFLCSQELDAMKRLHSDEQTDDDDD